MRKDPPAWALETATAQDHGRAAKAYQEATIQINWPESKALRDWAKKQGWPTSRFGFKDKFIKAMLENEANFALALHGSGLELRIPVTRYTISAEYLSKLDALYEALDETSGRPSSWGSLVEELRAIRRAVEIGVTVEVEDKKLKEFGSFYNWAHGRYHMLEDGYDDWIGNDS